MNRHRTNNCLVMKIAWTTFTGERLDQVIRLGEARAHPRECRLLLPDEAERCYVTTACVCTTIFTNFTFNFISLFSFSTNSIL